MADRRGRGLSSRPKVDRYKIFIAYRINFTNSIRYALLKEIQNLKPQIFTNLAELNAVCDDRFHWSEISSQISSMPTFDTSLENFWAKWD